MSPEGPRAQHWNEVYGQRGDADVSWFESEPSVSLELVDLLGIGGGHSAVDVGAGASRFVDALRSRGFSDLTAVDISDEGLALARARLGEQANAVRWEVADVLEWEPARQFDLWHDRAVFHFLTDPEDRSRYTALLNRSVPVGGFAIVATFAEDGPLQCSGLDVARYSPETLAAALGEGFEIAASRRHDHATPWGAIQPFTWLAVRRVAR
jgi:SAM-dependent methyltransferase